LLIQRTLATLLAVQTVFISGAAAQQSAPQTPMAAVPMVETLKVLVLEGQHAVNNTSRQAAIQPVVEVRDDNDRPVEGATVVFRVPPQGPGGYFGDHSATFSTKTNLQGQAAASTFVPNNVLGDFDIHVTATFGNRMGQTVITQTNSASQLLTRVVPPKKRWWRNKYILIGAGAAIATGVVLAVVLTRSSSSGNPTVTISPGPVTISQ
jgi:hypothetical protein